VRNRIALFSHNSSPSSQPRWAHHSCPSAVSFHRGQGREGGGSSRDAGAHPPQPPTFAIGGARVRPPILLAEALHVELVGSQVCRIPPLSHGRRASPGLQGDGRHGNDRDLGRGKGGAGGGGSARHGGRWTTAPRGGGALGGLRRRRG